MACGDQRLARLTNKGLRDALAFDSRINEQRPNAPVSLIPSRQAFDEAGHVHPGRVRQRDR
jgi:hypothetical protein